MAPWPFYTLAGHLVKLTWARKSLGGQEKIRALFRVTAFDHREILLPVTVERSNAITYLYNASNLKTQVKTHLASQRGPQRDPAVTVEKSHKCMHSCNLVSREAFASAQEQNAR